MSQSSTYLVSQTGNRPARMTDNLLRDMPRLLRSGTSITRACALCGIATYTYHRWMKEAEVPQNTWQQQFRDAVEPAIAAYFAELEQAAKDGAVGGRVKTFYKYKPVTDPDTGEIIRRDKVPVSETVETAPDVALRILERRDPSQWGRTNKVEVSGRDGGPIETVNINVDLTEDVYDRLSIDLRRRMLDEYDSTGNISEQLQLLLAIEMRKLGISTSYNSQTLDLTPAPVHRIITLLLD